MLKILCILTLLITSLSYGCGTNAEKQIQEKVTVQEKQNYYTAGEYQISKDMPAGEYVLVGEGEFWIREHISADNNKLIDRAIFKNRYYVVLNENRILTVAGDIKIYAIENAPKPEKENGIIKDGQYKIGVDVPVGMYEVELGENGYVETSKIEAEKRIITSSRDSTKNNKWQIAARENQYLWLKNAEINIEEVQPLSKEEPTQVAPVPAQSVQQSQPETPQQNFLLAATENQWNKTYRKSSAGAYDNDRYIVSFGKSGKANSIMIQNTNNGKFNTAYLNKIVPSDVEIVAKDDEGSDANMISKHFVCYSESLKNVYPESEGNFEIGNAFDRQTGKWIMTVINIAY